MLLRVFRCCGLDSIGNIGINFHRWAVSQWLGGSYFRKIFFAILFPLWAGIWLFSVMIGFFFDFIVILIWGITACCFRKCVPAKSAQDNRFEYKDVESECWTCCVHLGCIVSEDKEGEDWQEATCGDTCKGCMRSGTSCCDDGGGDKDNKTKETFY
eukprot:TRINITY_DN9756_c0_g1_i1.p1 TRINITY_DN9756_c0_g1~~TRINITY_DN9756_c0_g1_i1.p1  ORF type:complete len:156 (-),score=4.69 TRINITY_DN9756_c0_g1_i1:95-562(-)